MIDKDLVNAHSNFVRYPAWILLVAWAVRGFEPPSGCVVQHAFAHKLRLADARRSDDVVDDLRLLFGQAQDRRVCQGIVCRACHVDNDNI